MKYTDLDLLLEGMQENGFSKISLLIDLYENEKDLREDLERFAADIGPWAGQAVIELYGLDTKGLEQAIRNLKQPTNEGEQTR
tara:strand:+ start:1303 stop:1551 length:249 start_codon:yes stop_codon:yes gene_type:complete